jgi:hypothetical protein
MGILYLIFGALLAARVVWVMHRLDDDLLHVPQWEHPDFLVDFLTAIFIALGIFTMVALFWPMLVFLMVLMKKLK